MPLRITRGSEIKYNTNVIVIPEEEMIRAAGPVFDEGSGDAEELLRSGYQKSLALAEGKGPGPIALPLIPAEDLGLSKEENLRIAVDEIRNFLETSDRSIYLVVDDEKGPRYREFLRNRLDFYLGRYGLQERHAASLGSAKQAPKPSANSKPAPSHAPSAGHAPSADHMPTASHAALTDHMPTASHASLTDHMPGASAGGSGSAIKESRQKAKKERERKPWWRRREKEETFADEGAGDEAYKEAALDEIDEIEELDRKIKERLKHLSDTFSQYLLYLIEQKGMDNAEVYKRAIVDKKVFSKIKNNPNYHPQRMTALCLCIGAKLNMDETRDLLARAGYALSPSYETDAIFSFFIENGIYDMIELDIQLEEHGLPCIIT